MIGELLLALGPVFLMIGGVAAVAWWLARNTPEDPFDGGAPL